MEQNKLSGSLETLGGIYAGYQGINHGLPRALGIRIEYHSTSKKNAKLIQLADNYLNPDFGGYNGWAEKFNSSGFIKHSKNYVHITGINDKTNSKRLPDFISKYFMSPFRTLYRKSQLYMYKSIGNCTKDEILQIKRASNFKKIIFLLTKSKENIFNNKTKTFCISGIDSYFNSEFIADTDDFALKSSKKVKVFNNRFSAFIEGLKQFGLKGMKENKSRVIFGAGILSSGLYCSYKMIKQGIQSFKQNIY